MQRLKVLLLLNLALIASAAVLESQGQAQTTAPPNLDALAQELDRLNAQIEILEAQSGHSITIPDATVAQSNQAPLVPPPA
jgi:hypothetical protein